MNRIDDPSCHERVRAALMEAGYSRAYAQRCLASCRLLSDCHRDRLDPDDLDALEDL